MAGESMEQNDTTQTEAGEEAAVADEPEIDAVAAQADNPDAVRRALQTERETARKARKQVDTLNAKLKELEDRDKSEQEKVLEERDALKNELSPLKLENLKLRVAQEKKLPAELVDRLRGEDREELEADADALLALVAKTNGSRGAADLGARESGGPKQLSKADLKNMSPDQIVKARKEGRLDAAMRGE